MLEMASASSSSVLDSLNCPICLERYKTPRALPCLHTLCEECLGSYIASSVQRCSKFKCPVCRRVTSPPDEALGQLPHKWSQAFPKNHLVISFMESVAKSKHSEAKTHCQPCKRESPSTCSIAEFWCNECKEALCTRCNKRHPDMNGLLYHRTVHLDKEKTSVVKISDDECPRHVSKKYEVYCCDHGEMCCVVCLAVEHRYCKEVLTLDSITDKGNQRDVILKDLSDIKDLVLKVIEEKESNINSLNLESKAISAQIDDEVDQAKKQLDDLRGQLKQQCHVHCTTKTSLISESMQKLQKALDDMDNFQSFVDSAVNSDSGSRQQMFTAYTKVRRQLTILLSHLRSEPGKNSKFSFTFRKSDIVGKCKTIGELEVSTSPLPSVTNTVASIDNIIKRINHKGQCTETRALSTIDALSSSAKHVKSIARTASGFHHAEITGGVFLSDGRLLLTNYANELLLLDASFQIQKITKVRGRPTDITTGNSESEVFVAFESTNTVTSYDIEDEFKPLVTVNVRKPLCGIDTYKQFIFAAINDEGIVMMSMNGRIAATFSAVGEYRYVRVANEKLYHTDGDAVVCRTLEGREIFRYEHPALKTPTGLCLDSEGNLYVTGKQSGNVHQISFDGQRSRILINTLKHIKSPWAVVVDNVRKTLLVSSGNERIKLEVYELTE